MPPRQPPLSVRLSAEEIAELRSRAEQSGLTISGYFKAAVFNTPPLKRSRRVTHDQESLARLLASVGRIGSNINQLARVANMGSWAEADMLMEAAADIRWMRRTLMAALGITPEPEPNPEGRPS